MRSFMPDTNDLTGNNVSRIPSVMDNDPHADEEVINQQSGEQYPHATDHTSPPSPRIVPDDLADSIAYALDGSGPGPTNSQPHVSGHKPYTEGITGAGLDDEEEDLQT
ncbi:hypothetical protein HNV11_08245 [Spirosoma taeanense]|uniref:Uncharacterized protein n=1 Tax=Spirosoma taeanense TaxID=2735870 RepID=A0A6M5Y6B2_9BACT|nr:hypothetical protein [Spirosoma taeanense]QJW89375.1 hypothetical protein HNV11_08245 [Spirosoma taeanense]